MACGGSPSGSTGGTGGAGPGGTSTAGTTAFNAAIPRLVAERAGAGKHIVMVDMYSAFTADPNYKTALLFDGLHPDDAGYALMAQTWYPAISGFLR